jgi:hypothetical protein
MAVNEEKKEQSNAYIYFTQKELAKRWRITEATVVNIRNNGDLPFFTPPGSSRVLYPVEAILDIENQSISFYKKENNRTKQLTEINRELPVNPTNPNREWRI